jgi:hypothetical protein
MSCLKIHSFGVMIAGSSYTAEVIFLVAGFVAPVSEGIL